MENPAVAGSGVAMPNWAFALLLKPLIAMAMVALYYFGIIVPLRWAQRRLPDNAFWRFLFRERGHRNVRARAANPDQRLLN